MQQIPAKEKARELFVKYYSAVSGMDSNYIKKYIDLLLKNTSDNYVINSKHIAIYAVKDIVDVLSKASELNMLYKSEQVVYYQEVIRQLEAI